MAGPVFNAGAIEAHAKIDRSEFISDIRAMQAEIAKFQRDPIKLKTKIDRAALRADLAALKREFSGGELKLGISLNTAQAKRDIAAFKSYVRNLSPATLAMGATFAQARRDVAAYRQSVRNLAATQLRFSADFSQARNDLRAFQAATGFSAVTINVDAKVLKALLDLAQVENARRKLDGSNANINVGIGSGAGRVLGLIGLITAGISAIAYLAPAATAALSGMLATAGIGAQVVGALGFGLSGVGDAYKAMSQDAKSSGTAVAASNSGIASSMRSVENARRAQAHTFATTGRSVEDAERSLARAQDEARDAQEDLNDARAEEIRQLDELRERVRDFALDQEGAAIRVLEAEETLRLERENASRTPLSIRKAEYDLAVARERQRDLTREQVEATKELTDAERQGIEGSNNVVAARGQLANANERVEDAQRSLTRAQQDAAYAQEEAARAVMDALAGLEEAHASASNAGVAGANKVAYAMSKLSPEAQEFVRFLYDRVRPAMNEISDDVAGKMLPRLQTAGERLFEVQTELQKGLADTGQVIGDLAIAGANMTTSGPWRRDFADMMAANNRMLYNFGGAGLYTADSLNALYAVSLPMLETFSQWVVTSAALNAEWLRNKQASGELAQYFELVADRAEKLWDFFVELVRTAYDLGVALAPVGEVVLEIVTSLLHFVQWLSETNAGLVQFLAYGVLAYAAFVNLGKGVLAVGSATRLGIAGFSRLTDLITSASVSAGAYTTTLTGNAAAGAKVASSGTKVANALNRVGGALPIVGALVIAGTIAWQQHAEALEKAKEGWLKGGDATDVMVKGLLEQKIAAEQAVGGNVALSNALSGMSEQMDEAAAAGRRELAALPPLEQAKVRVTQATTAYNLAIRLYGENSAQAASASAQLAFQTQSLKTEQDKAADAAKSLTDRLVEQRNVILGTINAEIAYEDALDRVTESVAENGRTTDISSDAGRNNMRVLTELTRSGFSYIDQLVEQGATVDEVKQKEEQLKQRLYESAIQLGMTKEEARRYIDQLNLTPNNVQTNFFANTLAAKADIDRFVMDTKNILASYENANVVVHFAADTGNILNQGRAAGGPIFGPGTETSDSIPAKLSHNEHVWTGREVRGAGGHSNVMRIRKMAAAGQLPGFAAGGPVLSRDIGMPFASETVKARTDYQTAIVEYIKQLYAQPAPGMENFVGGSGVERWRGTGLQALGIAGQAPGNIGKLLMQMQTESGGNPTIVNKWDSNWQKGTPSVGLMQVIGPTYRAYRHPNFDVGPYSYGTSVNPLANILSSIRYTLNRYGSLASGWQGHGYDYGGIWRGGPGYNSSGRPERVLSPQQTQSFERLVEVLSKLQQTGNLFGDGGWLSSALSGRIPRRVDPSTVTRLGYADNGPASNIQPPPSIGTLVMNVPYGASPEEYVEHMDFALEYRRKKGVYGR